MRIYILGGSGMLGHAFIKYFSANHEVLAPSSKEVDITDYKTLKASVTAFKPDVVINLVALCDMEACDLRPDEALRLHALGSASAVLAAENANAVYVYLSSACVFDGESESYSVTSPTRPISTYGKTKLMGEHLARTFQKHIIVRTEWCFGGGPENDKKFIGKIYKQIQRGAQIVYAVNDKFGSLSYLPDLCAAVEKIFEAKQLGTFHIACEGSASRSEIAQEFVRLLGSRAKIQAVPSSYFEHFAVYTSPRPEWEVLMNSGVPGFRARHWKDALAEYVEAFRGRH